MINLNMNGTYTSSFEGLNLKVKSGITPVCKEELDEYKD